MIHVTAYRPNATETDKWLLLGSDPEFAITRNGRVMSASMMGIPGKDAKVNVPLQGKYFRDGWNLELNPMPTTIQGINSHFASTRLMLREVRKRLPEGCDISTRPAYKIRKEDLKTAPPDAVEFGCNPTQNAYNNGVPWLPDLDGWTHMLRYAGAHLHFGLKPGAPENITLANPARYPTLVKFLDYFVGLPATYVFSRPEQFIRRKYYGRAGEYREQNYPGGSKGLEYRVLTPEIYNHPAYFSLFAQAARKVIEWNWLEQEKWISYIKEGDLQDAINKGKNIEKIVMEEAKPFILGLYEPKTLKQLREKRGERLFTFEQDTPIGTWQGFADDWGIHVPTHHQ